jgi:hypothetical protein
MNAYYSANNSKINQLSTCKKATKKLPLAYVILEKIFCFIDLIIDFFTNSTVKTVAKFSAISVCFFAFIGIIASIESGAISIGLGITVSLFIVFIEALLLRKA